MQLLFEKFIELFFFFFGGMRVKIKMKKSHKKFKWYMCEDQDERGMKL